MLAHVTRSRRNITKGQQAMITAKAYPEAKMGRPKKGSEKVTNNLGLSGEFLRQARSVNEHAEDLVDAVVDGDQLRCGY